MATSKKTIVASPKKRAVVKRVETTTVSKTKAPKKVAKSIKTEDEVKPDPETVIAPPLKVKKAVKEEVQLPSNVSLRSKDKARAISDIIEHLEQPFFIIAYVSSACFFAVGLSLIASGHLKHVDLQLAELITSSSSIAEIGTSDSTTSGTNGGAANTITQVLNIVPTFELLDALPSVIDNDIRVAIYVANASQVQVKAYSKSSTKSYELPIEKVSNTSWRFTVPAKTLPSGEYSVRLQATSLSGSGVHSFTLGNFTRPETEATATTNGNTSETTTSNTTGSNTASGTSTTETNVDTVTDEEQVDETVSSTTTVPITTIISETTTKFELLPPSSPLSEFEAVRVLAPDNYSKIEVYVRPALSTQQIFVGSAFKSDNRWSLAFNTNNLPNGSYQMHAVATYQTQRIYSKSVSISIYNKSKIEVIKSEQPVAEPKDVTTKPATTEQTSTTSSTVERNFYSYEEDTEFVPTGGVPEAENEATNLIDEEKVAVNELLKNYAIATQADSRLLEHSLNQDFDTVRKEIIQKVLEDGNNKDSAEQIDNALKARFDELKKRVDSFEELRSSRTDSDIANDSDEDGISDFDEVEVYGTDPQSPDTDNDGFLDGVEVVRGFDPKDSRSEAIVEFELPQTTVGLARNDILVVHEVRPLIENDETLETPKVQTEISGKGLPNSFVTLYIFSTPTIVTIKTDADGSFTYTFDKELEDGEHEVYAAFTDNTGSIMAHSEPFRFVKEAEAFTPVGAAENELVTAPSLIESSRSEQTNTVIGLGILAFGIILLMLGMSIRPKKDELEQASV